MKRFIFLLVLFLIIIFIYIGQHIASAWIPVKKAVREKDFSYYNGWILVQQDLSFSTTPGWRKIGTNLEYYKKENIDNILLEGDIPIKVGYFSTEFANTYLCEIVEVPNNSEIFPECKTYNVRKWYPVYPVKRDRLILPEWVYPKDFMNKYDMNRDLVF